MSLLFPHSATLKRDTAVGTNGRKTNQNVGTVGEILFVPMPSRREVEAGWSVGSGYDIYVKDQDADIRTGDQLIYDGATYNVRAANKYDVEVVGHLHVLATREGV